MAWWHGSFVAALLVFNLALPGAYAGNTTCASAQLDWYTSVVGETPCRTYERLRQICNIDYQVPDFRSSPPGDQCDDQVSACCCNTVAFQLSMLCMNCQYLTVAGNIGTGIDAYIQTAVCNLDIRLDDFVYGGWDDGSWFYVFTKETQARITRFVVCPHVIVDNDYRCVLNVTYHHNCAWCCYLSATPSRTGTPNSDATNSSASKHSQTAAIVGGVVGGVGVLLLGIIAFFFWRRHRKHTAGTPGMQDRHFSYQPPPNHSNNPSRGLVDPFTPSVTGASMGEWSSNTRSVDNPSRFANQHMHSSQPSLATTGFTGESYSGQVPWAPAQNVLSANTTTGLSPSGTSSSLSALRHEDAGAVVDLSRSMSGRLPPAYRSWERGVPEVDADSNGGGGSQVSEPQSFGYAVETGAVAMGGATVGRRLPTPPSGDRSPTGTSFSGNSVPLSPSQALPPSNKEVMSRGGVNRLETGN
ncbi:uncharacterized protein BXZ73DRAFT_79178 [Epithele typhae]|uniref:uncharacterized protein n=1 Tax=Epithele typhae TaxID=378194 RepID=UPI002007C6A6|nr:uncharacterized protein BXZ73DRAFT_79178 [Epithele typhae]KAH9924616.1 hypothetical protein BXZ73DRAFT_79178 [Epithele typhae]